MFLTGNITFLYFLIIDGEIELLTTSESRVEDAAALYLEKLQSDYGTAPNWEAVGAQCVIVQRDDLYDIQISVPFSPLYDIKVKLTDACRSKSIEMFGRTMFNEFELLDWKYPEVVATHTFGRDDMARWVRKDDAPVDRAVNARRMPLGLPGGPCHVIRNIEEHKLPDTVKEDLIEDIEKGKDLSNSDADLLYDRVSIPSKIDLFKTLELTAHAQYRMDQRGVTVVDVQKGLDEFERWYEARRNSNKRLRPEQQKILTNLGYGDPVRFEASRSGVTIIFVVENRKGRLVSTWWTNTPNPKTPRPGECEVIPYIDRDQERDRPRILGGRMSKLRLAKMVARMYQANCGGDCGGDCGCGGNCGGDCGCKSAGDEMYLQSPVWDEGRDDDFLYAEDSALTDPESWYEDSVEDEEMENTVLTDFWKESY